MKCPNCQCENRDGAKFCNECGFPLSGRIAAMAAASDDDIEQALDKPAQNSTKAPDTINDELNDAPGHIQVLSYTQEAPHTQEASHTSDTSHIPDASHISKAAEVTADLSGVERLVSADYIPPASSFNAGDTLEIPVQSSNASSQKRDFLASSTQDKKRKKSQTKNEENTHQSSGYTSFNSISTSNAKSNTNAHTSSAASANTDKKGVLATHKGIVALVCVALVALTAVALLTYNAELWGGHVVPDVSGKSVADAILELESRGFTVKTMEVKSDDVEGKVLLSDPQAGSRQEAGAQIVIHVSAARVIPEVVGLSKDEAAQRFAAEGLETIEYVDEYSDSTKGTVLSIEPVAGQKAKAETSIVVKVATPYVVPDVAGKSASEAEELVKNASFAPNIVHVYTEEVSEGKVIDSDPVAGTELASGSNVTINVAKSRSAELISSTHTYFQSSSTFTIDGATYEVNSDTLDVTYTGNTSVKYSISARVVETQEYQNFGSQTLYGDWKTISGSITWDDEGKSIDESSPKIARTQS